MYKPCPFCGEAVALELEVIGATHWIVCKTCNANGPSGTSKGEAWSRWELRPSEFAALEAKYEEGWNDCEEELTTRGE